MGRFNLCLLATSNEGRTGKGKADAGEPDEHHAARVDADRARKALAGQQARTSALLQSLCLSEMEMTVIVMEWWNSGCTRVDALVARICLAQIKKAEGRIDAERAGKDGAKP